MELLGLIEIGIIQELAIASTIGVMVIILTNLILLPILLSYIPFVASYRDRLRRGAQRKEMIEELRRIRKALAAGRDAPG